MHQSISLVGIVESFQQDDTIDDLTPFSAHLNWILYRGDLIRNVQSIDWSVLPNRIQTIFSLRSQEEGGNFTGTMVERQAILLWAVQRFDLIELEEKDCISPILEKIPYQKRLISWHGGPSKLSELKARFERLATIPARFYQMIPEAQEHGDELEALQFLKELGRKDTICYASGSIGLWTQIVAAHLGAPMVYARLNATFRGGYPFYDFAIN